MRQLALSLLLWACLHTRAARADAELIPAPDGHIGTYLVIGPLSRRTDVAAHLPELEPAYAQTARPIPGTWQVQYTATGALDLEAKLGARTPGSRALLGGVLHLSQPFAGYLLLSVDGAASVYVDGGLVWEHHEQRLRGSSWDAIPLKLGTGAHPVVLSLEHPGRHWALETRWLSAHDLRPPKNMRWILPKTSEAVDNMLRARLVHSHVDTKLDEHGFSNKISVSFPRGAIAGAMPKVFATRRFPSDQRIDYELGPLLENAHGAQRLTARLPTVIRDELPPGTRWQQVTIRLDKQRHSHKSPVSREAIDLFRRARQAQATLASDLALPRSLRELVHSTLEFRLQQLRRAADGGEAYELNRAISELKGMLDRAQQDAGFPLTPGVHELAHLSALDGKPQSFWLHVPDGFDPHQQIRYPLVLALHGYNGSPQGITQAFLDTRRMGPKSGVDGFVVAPEAHGNSFYRGAGEFEAMAVLELVRSLYPIDPSRISVTGVSMGGTGAAQLALRYADTFAAAAPLCGYHSFFVRRDTRGRQPKPWEVSRMQHWSTASWADNGRHIPMFVAHGTQDHPLENSRILIRSYQERGFSLQQEWPDTGHSVWTVSYQGARLWPWLSQKVRPSTPNTISIYSHSLRYAKQHWAKIDQFLSFDRAATLSCERTAPHTFKVTTENVQRFELESNSAGAAGTPHKLEIDGEMLQVPPGIPLRFHKSDSWQLAGTLIHGATAARPKASFTEKRPGVEGPIRDVFLGKVAFVYGTLSPRTSRVNREVAEQFGRYHQGLTLSYPVLSDRQLTDAVSATHSLVLVGTPRDHRLLRRFSQRLPIRADDTSIHVGDQRFAGPGLGASFIYPNPEHPERYLVVITGTDIAGVLRALSLPRLLPDYIVYDNEVRSAATQQILGDASVLAAGYFTPKWTLPDSERSLNP